MFSKLFVSLHVSLASYTHECPFFRHRYNCIRGIEFSMNKFLLFVVVLAGKSAVTPVVTQSACGEDGSGNGYWLEESCYDITKESEDIKQEMYSICPVLRHQNLTFFPNKFNHENPEQALDVLRKIINNSCHHLLNDFICHFYFPPCIDDVCILSRMHPRSNILKPMLVYPCRSMCTIVTKRCKLLFRSVPANLRECLRCTNFAEEGTAPCIVPVIQEDKEPKKQDGGNLKRSRRLIGKLKHVALFPCNNPEL